MKKTKGPFGCLFWIVITVTFVTAEIIGVKNKMGPIDSSQFSGYCIGLVSLIYGFIYHIFKKWKK